MFRALLCCGLAVLVVTPAGAAEKLRVVKAVAFAWTFTPLDVGIADRHLRQARARVEASAAAGDAKLQQALTADSADIGIGSGPGMAFMAKGVPAKAVGRDVRRAEEHGGDGRLQFADQDGRRSQGQEARLHHRRLADPLDRRPHQPRSRAGAPSGITMVPIGGMPPARAAMKTNQIDGYIGALESGYALEEQKEWRVITGAAPFVDDFITHVFFARDELIQKRPEVVRAFLKGWMDTIAFMKANKDKTVEITSKVINVPPSVAARAYDEQIGTFSTDGTFDPKAVAALKTVVHRDGPAEGNSGGRRDVHDAIRAGEIERTFPG